MTDYMQKADEEAARHRCMRTALARTLEALDTANTRADAAEKRERELREAVHMAKLELGSHGPCVACSNAHSILKPNTLIQPEPDPMVERRNDFGGYVVGNGDRTKWRAWKNGWSSWVDDPADATRYHFRTDAMAAHEEDEDAWCIVPFAELSIVKGESL